MSRADLTREVSLHRFAELPWGCVKESCRSHSPAAAPRLVYLRLLRRSEKRNHLWPLCQKYGNIAESCLIVSFWDFGFVFRKQKKVAMKTHWVFFNVAPKALIAYGTREKAASDVCDLWWEKVWGSKSEIINTDGLRVRICQTRTHTDIRCSCVLQGKNNNKQKKRSLVRLSNWTAESLRRLDTTTQAMLCFSPVVSFTFE